MKFKPLSPEKLQRITKLMLPCLVCEGMYLESGVRGCSGNCKVEGNVREEIKKIAGEKTPTIKREALG